jgi:hypothetical protein
MRLRHRQNVVEDILPLVYSSACTQFKCLVFERHTSLFTYLNIDRRFYSSLTDGLILDVLVDSIVCLQAIGNGVVTVNAVNVFKDLDSLGAWRQEGMLAACSSLKAPHERSSDTGYGAVERHQYRRGKGCALPSRQLLQRTRHGSPSVSKPKMQSPVLISN